PGGHRQVEQHTVGFELLAQRAVPVARLIARLLLPAKHAGRLSRGIDARRSGARGTLRILVRRRYVLALPFVDLLAPNPYVPIGIRQSKVHGILPRRRLKVILLRLIGEPSAVAGIVVGPEPKAHPQDAIEGRRVGERLASL